MNATERASDSYGSWALAVAARREQRVRSGEYEPTDDRERRQAAEGPRQANQLDAAKDQPS